MGTDTNKSRDRTIKISDSMDESAECSFKFNYMKNNPNTSESLNPSETTVNTKKPESSDLIPFKFEWKEGGTDVKISGDFLDNWNTKEPLKYNNETKSFEITLKIPRGINQFKFIVNDKWICSKNYKIINDKNNNYNYNNEIDTNTFNENSSTNSVTNSIYQEMKKKKKKVSKGNNDYNCIIPNKSSVNAEAPIIPLYFKALINLEFNSNQLKQDKFKDSLENKLDEKSEDKSKKKDMLAINKTRDLLENNTFKSIMTIPHEKLSHIFFNPNSGDKYIRSALTQRNKHKFLTLVYFSPKKL